MNSSYNAFMQSRQLLASLILKRPWNRADKILTVMLIVAFGLFYAGQVSDFPALEDDGLFVLASAFLGTAAFSGLSALYSAQSGGTPVASRECGLAGSSFWCTDGVDRLGVALLHWPSAPGTGKGCLSSWSFLRSVLDFVLGVGLYLLDFMESQPGNIF